MGACWIFNISSWKEKSYFLLTYFLDLKHSPVEHEALQKSEFKTSEGHESSRRKNSLVDRSPSHFKLNTIDLYTQTWGGTANVSKVLKTQVGGTSTTLVVFPNFRPSRTKFIFKNCSCFLPRFFWLIIICTGNKEKFSERAIYYIYIYFFFIVENKLLDILNWLLLYTAFYY